MFRLYSKGCEHVIRVLTQVPPSNGTKWFKASEICQKVGISESSTRKVLQSLVADGFLEAVRGPDGGYHLADDPENITLLSIIQAVDGEEAYGDCILGLPECNAKAPCPMHFLWLEAKDDLLKQLTSTTLKDLIDTHDSREAMKKKKKKV